MKNHQRSYQSPSARKQEKRFFENRDLHNKLGAGALLLRFTFIFTLGARMFCLDAFVVPAEVRKVIGYSETEVTDSRELPCCWWEPNLLQTTDIILTTESSHQHLKSVFKVTNKEIKLFFLKKKKMETERAGRQSSGRSSVGDADHPGAN